MEAERLAVQNSELRAERESTRVVCSAVVCCSGVLQWLTAFERRGNNSRGFKDIYLKAKAIIRP